jgi:hypothetical protein
MYWPRRHGNHGVYFVISPRLYRQALAACRKIENYFKGFGKQGSVGSFMFPPAFRCDLFCPPPAPEQQKRISTSIRFRKMVLWCYLRLQSAYNHPQPLLKIRREPDCVINFNVVVILAQAYRLNTSLG